MRWSLRSVCVFNALFLLFCVLAQASSSERVTRGLSTILDADTPPTTEHTHHPRSLYMADHNVRDQAIMVPGTRAIYTRGKDGKKHLIPDWETFVNAGYEMDMVYYISNEEMAKLEEGDEMQHIVEETPRDERLKCPCSSLSRQPYADDRRNTRPRNTCILKNEPFDKLFSQTYELPMLQHHMRFFLVDEEHVQKEEIARWKLYNHAAGAYVQSRGDYTQKYKEFPTIGSFTKADDMGTEAIDADEEGDDGEEFDWFDSDVDPYPSPYFSNGNEAKTRRHLRETQSHSHSRRQQRMLEVDKDGMIECDVLIEIMPDDFDFASHVCPGVCQPHPRAFVSMDALLPEPKQPKKDLTCSLTLEHIFATASEAETKRMRALDEENPKDAAHARLAMVLHSIARRKMEECAEREHWLPLSRNRLAKTTAALHGSYQQDPVKRKLRGVIIWIGSISRFDLARAQVEVLQSQKDVAAEDRIIGWLASEEIYDCAVGSTICTDLTPHKSYRDYMPSSSLDVKSAGYACAQRRPLRALAHILHLFDPEFIFIVDDDTWVNVDMLKVTTPLDGFIKEELANKPIVLGQLNHGSKITRKGFFYGGAGYLFGRSVINALQSNFVKSVGSLYDHAQFNPTVADSLQMLKESVDNAKETCPGCFIEEVLNPKEWKNWGEGAYLQQNNARLVDLCSNIMSEEHTCYHSDHAMTRCLIHGVYADAYGIECWGTPVKSSRGNQIIGMCMGIDECTKEQLTCHRWMPDPKDYRKSIPSNSSNKEEIENDTEEAAEEGEEDEQSAI